MRLVKKAKKGLGINFDSPEWLEYLKKENAFFHDQTWKALIKNQSTSTNNSDLGTGNTFSNFSINSTQNGDSIMHSSFFSHYLPINGDDKTYEESINYNNNYMPAPGEEDIPAGSDGRKRVMTVYKNGKYYTYKPGDSQWDHYFGQLQGLKDINGM